MSFSPTLHIAFPPIAGACLLLAAAHASAEPSDPTPADAAITDASDAGSLPAVPDASPPLVADAPASAPPAPPPSNDLPLVLLAAAATDTGTLPRTAVGAGGGVGLDAKPFRAEATLTYFPSVSNNVAGTTSTGGSFSMLVTVIRGCALADVKAFSLGACGGLGLTNMQASTFSPTLSSTASASWSSFVADALGLWHVARLLTLRLTVGTEAPFSRPTFAVGATIVHQPAPASLDLGLGVETQF